MNVDYSYLLFFSVGIQFLTVNQVFIYFEKICVF